MSSMTSKTAKTNSVLICLFGITTIRNVYDEMYQLILWRNTTARVIIQNMRIKKRTGFVTLILFCFVWIVTENPFPPESHDSNVLSLGVPRLHWEMVKVARCDFLSNHPVPINHWRVYWSFSIQDNNDDSYSTARAVRDESSLLSYWG